MSDETSNQRPVAEELIENLKVQAEQLRGERTDAIAEQWVEIASGHCRVAVCNSPYGTHFEIGPLQGSKAQPTKVFAGPDQDKAIALLIKYIQS